MKIFTLDEANNLIPELRTKLSKIVDISSRIELITEALRYSQVNPDISKGNKEVTNERLDELSLGIKDAVAHIQNSGCIIKDVERGIVDFYSKKDGELVFLCWKLGENEIKYWHHIEGGFVGRTPILE